MYRVFNQNEKINKLFIHLCNNFHHTIFTRQNPVNETEEEANE